jgi:hypothetical protein
MALSVNHPVYDYRGDGDKRHHRAQESEKS